MLGESAVMRLGLPPKTLDAAFGVSSFSDVATSDDEEDDELMVDRDDGDESDDGDEGEE
jgi:hypothetical protein